MSLNIRDLEEAGKSMEEARGKLQDLVERRGQVIFQQRECETVLEEFEFLNETDVVMKQVGPALIRQPLAEAKENVRQRLDFIKRQFKDIEAAIEDAQKVLAAAEQRLQQMQPPQQ
jgi:chaperonin cofactor prefoldin